MNNVMNVMNSMNSISTVQLLRSGTSPSFPSMKPTLQGGTCSSVAALRHLYQSNMQAVTRIAQLRTTRSEVLPQSSQLHHKKGDIPPRAGIFLPWQKWNGKFLPSPVHSTPTNELWNMTDELWTMKYDLWTMIYELRSVNSEFRTMNYELRTTRSEVLPQSSQLHHKKGDIPPRAGIFLPWQKWNGKFLPSPVHSTPTNELWNMTDELWTMKYDLWTMIYELRSVNSEFRTMNYELWTMNYELWAINYELWTMNYELWTLNYELWAPSYEPLRFPALGTVTRSDTAFGQVMAKY